jgi:radical SAM protein with 4Fe4S-binding SPASM domain
MMNKAESIKSVNLTDRLYYKAAKAGVPLGGTFELTPACNFNCKMCYIHSDSLSANEIKQRQLNFENWIEIAKCAKSQGTLYLLLTGGEPLIYPDFWRLYEELTKMGFILNVNTNGSMITDDVVSRFAAMPPKRINISLYGADNETYHRVCGQREMFTRVDNAIKKLLSKNIQIRLNCSITPDNADNLEQIVDYSKKMNLPLHTASYMFPPIRRASEKSTAYERFSPKQAAYYRLKACRLQSNDEQYDDFIKKVMKGESALDFGENCLENENGSFHCRAGRASFWITWDGFLTPCGMLNEPKVNLAGTDFSTAWKELNSKSKSLVLCGSCAKCSFREICHNCVAISLAETGSINEPPSYLCETMDALRLHIAKEI